MATSMLLLLLWLGTPSVQAAEADAVLRIKTAYLLNIAKFMRWPEEAEARSLDLCVVARVSTQQYVEQALAGRLVQGRTVVIRSYPEDEVPRAPACDMIYLERAKAVLPERVLSIGESEDYVERGGMIAFVTANDRVRFVVNLKAIREQGLEVDARLLAVALKVLR